VPSPIGHALGALACGWLAAPPPDSRPRLFVQAAILAAVGVAPDLDILVDRHRAESHSLAAALIVAAVAAWRRWPVADTRWRIGCAVFLAWASHPLLDAFGHDAKPPLGTMAFWPVSSEYYKFPWTVFAAITRRWHGPQFLVYNGLAVLRECLILVPVTAAVAWWRGLRRS
jgi:membrane-bound metal-dependent hydrolase YbcI (DUF457 family)